MSEREQWFKLSRREFSRAAAVSIVSGVAAAKASAMSEQTQPATTQASDVLTESRVRWLEDQLGRVIAPELRAKVAQQIANNDGMWKGGRKFPVPDQTEPAFVFEPVPASRGKQ